MKEIGREQDVEKINRIALSLAREIADKHNKLFAGGISMSLVYVPGDKEAADKVREMFDEQVRWSKEEGVDYIIVETMLYLGEARIALEVVKSYDEQVRWSKEEGVDYIIVETMLYLGEARIASRSGQVVWSSSCDYIWAQSKRWVLFNC